MNKQINKNKINGVMVILFNRLSSRWQETAKLEHPKGNEKGHEVDSKVWR